MRLRGTLCIAVGIARAQRTELCTVLHTDADLQIISGGIPVRHEPV